MYLLKKLFKYDGRLKLNFSFPFFSKDECSADACKIANSQPAEEEYQDLQAEEEDDFEDLDWDTEDPDRQIRLTLGLFWSFKTKNFWDSKP